MKDDMNSSGKDFCSSKHFLQYLPYWKVLNYCMV